MKLVSEFHIGYYNAQFIPQCTVEPAVDFELGYYIV